MKKLNLLFTIIIGLMFVSCSSDDNIDVDLIVGQWKNSHLIYIYNDGSTERIEIPIHALDSRIIFQSNGNVNGIEYGIDGLGNISSIEFSGTWEKLSDDKYSYTLMAEINNAQVTNTITPESLTFPDNNTMNRKFFNNGNFANTNIESFIEVSIRVE